MKNYSVGIERIRLDKITFGQNVRIGAEVLVGCAITPELLIQKTVTDMLLALRQDVFAQKIEEVSHSYPSDWWQAFKARWFPNWLLRRYPVTTTTFRLTASALYPKIAFPDGTMYMEKIVNAGGDGTGSGRW